VPATYSQPASSTYNLIGYYTGGSASFIGRNRTPATLAARVQFDYFLLKTDGKIYDADGVAVYSQGSTGLPPLEFVPVIQETKYFGLDLTTTSGGNLAVVQLGIFADHIGYYSQGVYPLPGTAYGSYWPSPNLDAYPARDAYQFWIDYNHWKQHGGSAPSQPTYVEFGTPALAQAAQYYSNTHTKPVGGNPGQTLFELVSQASSLRRWMGNIIERETVFILPA
jgi:hypothetical protein